ncbi:hypothetical protein [Thiothrix eikelboomii]|uniref:hypothetical protein n=1 Tax=Thiothrix eikelboomii TaxID=92487 RepID=UPI003BAF6C2E
MKNICFIGTSHLGSVASAWHKRIAPLYPEFKPSFFAGPGTSLYQAEFLPNQIKAPADSQLEEYFRLSADGLTMIELDQYDCFIFQSLDEHFMGISEICQLMAVENEDEHVFFSTACLEATVEASIERSPVTRYVQHIRSCVDTPIIVSMTPKTSILAIEKHPEEYAPYLQYAEFFQDLFIKARTKILNYPKLTMVEQPEETLATPYFTKVEYLNPYGKQNLANVTDYWHKNVKYGKAALIKILEHIKTIPLSE